MTRRDRMRLGLGRLTLRGLGRVWPRFADARALALFARPLRPGRLDPAAIWPAPRTSTRVALAPAAAGNDRNSFVVSWSWGTGPTVLLSHGWNAHAADLSALVGPLVGAGFRAVAFDHVGHGASAGGRSSVRHFQDGLLAVARSCVGKEGLAAFIGHSLGATTAVLALGTGPAGLAGCTGPGFRLGLVAPPLDPVRYALDTFASAMRLAPERRAAMLARLQASPDSRLEGAEVLRLARAQQHPVLIAHDRGDLRVPVADGRALATAWPGSRFYETSGLGHRRILSDPAVVTEMVRFVSAR